MKFSLFQLEQHIDDEIVEKAEELLNQNLLDQLVEIEKNLWSTKVHAEEEYEVEIQLSTSKVMAYSCDCEKYGPKNICIHLSAAMLRLRQLIRELEAEKQAQKAAHQSPKRLTTNIILQEIDSPDLKEFVRSYAKNNRQFALALKARFASSVSAMDREEKYVQLLATALKSVKRQGRLIRQPGLKQLAQVVEELQMQSIEAIEKRDFQEAFAMIQAIFAKVPEALRISDGDKKILLEVLIENFPLLHQLLAANPAPDLVSEIWNYILESFSQQYLALYGIDRHFLALALELTRTKSRAIPLLEALDAVLERDRQSGSLEIDLLIAKLDLLELSGQEALALALQKSHLNEAPILLKAIDFAQQKEDWPRIKKLASQALMLEHSPDIKAQLEDHLLNIALAENDRPSIITLAKCRYLASYEQKYWDHLKALQEKSWSLIKTEIINALKKQSFSIGQRDALARIYASEADGAQFFSFLKETRSIDLLLQYDQQLPSVPLVQIHDLHRELLLEYLNQHLGRQASVKVKRVLQHLRDTGAKDFVKQLIEEFRKDYGGRHSLLEELEEF